MPEATTRVPSTVVVTSDKPTALSFALNAPATASNGETCAVPSLRALADAESFGEAGLLDVAGARRLVPAPVSKAASGMSAMQPIPPTAANRCATRPLSQELSVDAGAILRTAVPSFNST